MNITASDKASLLRLAASLPNGSEQRREILSRLQRAAAGDNLQHLVNKGWVGSGSTGWSMVVNGGGMYAECHITPKKGGFDWDVTGSHFDGYASSGRPRLETFNTQKGMVADPELARSAVVGVVQPWLQGKAQVLRESALVLDKAIARLDGYTLS